MIRRYPSTRAAVCVLAAAVLATQGCQRFRERWRNRDAAEAAPARVDAARPPETIDPDAIGVNPGLEVVVWTAQDFGYAAARALLPYAERPLPMPASDAAAWRRAGLRPVAVPIEDLDAVIAGAPPIFPVQREIFGQLTRWSPIIRGPRAPALTLDPGDPLPAGRPRLIARAWIEPDLSSGVPRDVVRVEIGVQIESDRRDPGTLARNPDLGTIADQGVIAQSLLTSFTADGADAVVIVGEAPGVDWSDLPEPSLASAASPDAVGPGTDTDTEPASESDPGSVQAPGATPPARAASPIGPTPPAERTLGEWMLTAPGTSARDGRPSVAPRRVFVVLIPRTPPASTPDPAAPPTADGALP